MKPTTFFPAFNLSWLINVRILASTGAEAEVPKVISHCAPTENAKLAPLALISGNARVFWLEL
jgi:hypothetical protein